MAEVGENSHGKNYLCKIGLNLLRTPMSDKRLALSLSPMLSRLCNYALGFKGHRKFFLAKDLLAQQRGSVPVSDIRH